MNIEARRTKTMRGSLLGCFCVLLLLVGSCDTDGTQEGDSSTSGQDSLADDSTGSDSEDTQVGDTGAQDTLVPQDTSTEDTGSMDLPSDSSPPVDTQTDTQLDTTAPPDQSNDTGSPDTPDEDAGGGCGTEDPGMYRFPQSCSEPECHDDEICVRLILAGFDYEGYSACGASYTFDEMSSDQACENLPSGGGFNYPPDCGRLEYSGSIRHYCNADSSAVVAYFTGTATEFGSSFVTAEWFGHEYESGGGGGSGDYSDARLSSDFSTLHIHGFQQTSVRPSSGGFDEQNLRVWFLTSDMMTPGELSITGGFDIMLHP